VILYFDPFDILLKYKALQRNTNYNNEGKNKGCPGKKPERPLLSDVLNEVRTFFEGEEGKSS
jgi:hypothetical protein